LTGLLEWATFLTAVTSLVAVTGAMVQLRQLRKQRMRDFEDLFVQRYWNIMDRLSLAAIECDVPEDRAVAAGDRLAVVAYLRLCEDELDLRGEGWISGDTWQIWHAGMVSQLRRWPFADVWKDVSAREETEGTSGQFIQLRQAGEDLYRPGFEPVPRSSLIHRLGRGR
jgi:hypothetical protein